MATSCFAITGGCGFIGLRLAHYLLDVDSSNTVILIDIRPPPENDKKLSAVDKSRLTYRYCDLRSIESVNEALTNATCVFHLASYGMSGREMLHSSMIYEVNVIGTENIINACIKHGIKKLIYCSTYNTVYTGEKPLRSVTEDECPYPSEDKFCDNYSRTKSLAERAIIKASSSKLSTVAIRPAAIYGDGEQRHIPRVINLIRQGLGFFVVGSDDILCDWLYADNLVYALVLAEKSLPKHSGEAYFISDDHPVNNFHFLSQLTKGLGYDSCFTVHIPTFIMFYFAYLIEIMYHLVAKYVFDFAPFLTRTEVLKVGVTHYANISKAKNLLGYEVKVSPDEAMRKCIKWYSENGYGNTINKENRRQFRFMSVGLAVIILIIFYFYQLIS